MDCAQQVSFFGVPAILESPAIRSVIETARRVAGSSVAVLITGETGSGKEIVARAVHQFSLRSARPWVDINCGALPDQLMESELFGHEKGAFSGADTEKPGLFELANNGTLFLDEVGELDPRMQVKLLRVLDGVPYYRVGGRKKISVDVRIVAATNQEPEEQVATGRFRSDLFHRLNQFRIRVPPLRERVQDIIPLAKHFLKQQNPQAVLSPDAEKALEAYSWPGNIRELRNALIHAGIAAQSYEIQASDLPVAPLRANPALVRAENGRLQLDGVERDAIHQALARTHGHHQKAADLLGISRRTLSRKLKLYRLQGEEATA
ncbi:MAG: sigma-54-dependent Fis family transcriptional regulator [Acidobacteriia bacterium]|nr:sigma-54-dependent Fis family transcriptional regulator [Terriglobia bacterium]